MAMSLFGKGNVGYCRACGNGNSRQMKIECRDPKENPRRYRIYCSSCGTTTDYLPSERDAVKAWNEGRVRMK